MKTLPYETKLPLPYIFFEYPENWEVSQITGKGYKEIMILGPRNIEDTFNLAMVVRFNTLQENLNLHSIAENYIIRRQKLSGFGLKSRYTSNVGGLRAEIIEVSFLSPKSLETLKPDFMEINEKRAMIINTNTLIEVIFTGVSRDFISFIEDIERILETISFAPSDSK